MGPRLLISEAGLERSGLEQVGSRILRRTLVKLPEGSRAEAAEELAEQLREVVGQEGIYRIETFADAQPALRRGLRRIERFLGLVALLSLLIGGIGVAQTVRAWLASRMDTIAILRCLGMRPKEVVILYLGQTTVLSLIGSLLGAGLGTLIIFLIPDLLAAFLPTASLEVFQPAAIARGLALGVGVALLFALEPLLEVRKVPPLRVFQRNLEAPRSTTLLRMGMLFVLLLGIWLAASLQGESFLRGGIFAAGVGTASLILVIASLGVTKLIARFPLGRRAVWLRYGLKSLARPGAPTMGSLVALGLGVLFVVAMSLVEGSLSTDLTAELPKKNSFLLDVQPAQWNEVEEILRSKGATSIDSVPVVSARLTAIDDRTIADLASSTGEGNRQRRWALTREQRLTYAEKLQDDNKVVEGELWHLEGVDEVSVEQDFANDLAVQLGSTLRLDIQGTEIGLTVSSVRTVDWETFGINFFLVVEPGVLESAPQVRLAAANLPPTREQEIQDALALEFPNITLIRTREVLEKIAGVLHRLGTGVRFLGGFTVVAGLIILTGAVTATSMRRGREVALLKTLGSTRREVMAMFMMEHAVLGGVAGVIGSVGGSILAWVVVTKGFEMSWTSQPGFLVGAILLSVILTSVTSVAAGWPALSRRPMEVFRSEA
jgi:putative ABC transport system permease protein